MNFPAIMLHYGDICFESKRVKDFKTILVALKFLILAYFSKQDRWLLKWLICIFKRKWLVFIQKELKEYNLGGWIEITCYCEIQGPKLKSLNHVQNVQRCLLILLTYTLFTTFRAINDFLKILFFNWHFKIIVALASFFMYLIFYKVCILSKRKERASELLHSAPYFLLSYMDAELWRWLEINKLLFSFYFVLFK